MKLRSFSLILCGWLLGLPVLRAQYVQLQKLPAAPATTITFGKAVAMEGSTLVVGSNGDDSQTGAAYVYEKGNDGTWTKIARLTASDRAGFDRFGASVALSGNTIVVGANLGEPDGGQFNQGQAYVFVKPAGGWTDATETAILRLTNGVDRDEFGSAVAVSGDVVAVGVGQRGSQSNVYDGRGAVFIFEKPGGGWATTGTPTATITVSDAADGDHFGSSVALDGNTLLAGAPEKNVAYVFTKPGGGWATTSTFTARLTGSGVGSGDFFGRSVALAGGTAVVGAPYEFIANAPNENGAAYVFVRPGGGWATGTETARLTASDGALGDQFGHAVALAGDLVLVGAPFDDDKGNGAGSAYVFTKPGGGWATTNAFAAKLLAADGTGDPKAGGDAFGSSVAASAAGLAVGAPVHGASFTGAVYLFGPCPALAFGFSAQAGGNPVALDNASAGASATFSLCPSGSLMLSGFSSTSSSGVKFRRALTVTGAVNDNGSPLSSATTVVSDSFFGGTLGPYALASGSSGSVVLVFTPFTDLNDDDQLDEGECTGNAITLTVNLGQIPGVSITNLGSSYCANGNPVVLAGSPVGGTFSGPGVSSGVFTPANAGSGGSIQYAYTDPASGCVGTASQNVTLVSTASFTGQPTLGGSLLCAGQTVTLAFGVECASSATYTAQLSDKDGSFAVPLATWPVTPGANPLTLPLGLPTGNGYRVRVVQSSPALTSDPTVSFTISALMVALYPATPGALCQGDALPVTFSTLGGCSFPQGNVFTVQLSNASGSFANPRTLGLAQPGTTTFPASLLSGLPAGTGYRVRVLSSNPALTSFASYPFELRFPGLSSLTPGVGGVPQGGLCRGNNVTLSLPTGSCAFPNGNQFTAQLSSATGSFASPVSLGVVQAGVPNSLTIPANSAAGTGYRIRVLSSQPASTSLASIPFRVNACNARLSAEEAELVVAPNPVKGGNAFPGEIRVRVSGMDSPAFTLTGSTGRSMGLSVQPDGSGEFVLTPRQALAPGVYAVQASEGTTRLTRRVLVVE